MGFWEGGGEKVKERATRLGLTTERSEEREDPVHEQDEERRGRVEVGGKGRWGVDYYCERGVDWRQERERGSQREG